MFVQSKAAVMTAGEGRVGGWRLFARQFYLGAILAASGAVRLA